MRPAGFEPAAFGSGGQRSIQLSYGRVQRSFVPIRSARVSGRISQEPLPVPTFQSRVGRQLILRGAPNPEGVGAPGRRRTCDLRIRSPALYPTELRARDTESYHLGSTGYGRAE